MVQKKGFTLIELIIVIALIALLATTVILVINPVNIFREARDSQRIADLGQMNSAMSLLLATAKNPPTSLGVGTSSCYYLFRAAATVPASCGGRYVANATNVVRVIQTVDGSGWVPVNLNDAANGAPISVWPIDPRPRVSSPYVATTSYYYSYASDGTSWEFTAHMESERYASSGLEDVESTDGGNIAHLFEVGTAVGL